jgi:asparagine synthase (glutamine-hydrolysing)
MCGVLGMIGYKISEAEFTRELNKMEHRGPDGFGVWSNDDSSVRLGHRRLAIIDVDPRSDQPMIYANRYVMVYNGEIYNYVELRSELEKEGVHFDTASDSEVLLKLIIHKGASVLTRLNGMWALAIFDTVEQTLFLSRDRLGKKPLYISSDKGRLAFSSEMKGLYHLFGVLEYDRDYIDVAVNTVMDAERLKGTLIKGIDKFPPGSYGVFREGVLKIEPFYFPEQLLKRKSRYRRFEDAVDEFQYLFQSACSLRMRSDVPVGSALSGGIDSGLVVSTISKLGFARTDYKALVSSFPGSFLDETTDAELVAHNAGINFEAIVIKPDLDPDHILEAIYQFEDIAGTTPIPFFQL